MGRKTSIGIARQRLSAELDARLKQAQRAAAPPIGKTTRRKKRRRARERLEAQERQRRADELTARQQRKGDQMHVGLIGIDTFEVWIPNRAAAIARGILRDNASTYVMSAWYGDLDRVTYNQVHQAVRRSLPRFKA